MGIDAHVNCNCYEEGKLLTLPPYPEIVCVEENGELACRDLNQFSEFDEWLENHACEHRGGVALHYYLGNISLVAFLRKELEKNPDDFPQILAKVIYNGIHAGDYIPVDEVKVMQEEVARLSAVHSEDSEDEKILRNFEKQMTELVQCSLQMKKPIVF